MSEGMLPLDQLRCAEAADEIWVPTQWHRDLFEAQGLPPARLSVVPEFVDTQLFRPRAAAAARRRGRRGGATFLSVFKWERRKGWGCSRRTARRGRPRQHLVISLRVTV